MKEVKFKGGKVEAKVADNVFRRAKGLSFRKKGKMLFKFPNDTRAPIDMMLMRKSLYLYFMNSKKEVIHIEKADPWYQLPKKFFHRPKEKYRYLLESFEKLDIKEDDILNF